MKLTQLKVLINFYLHLLGHEGSGIVEKIGEGVTRVKTGDHVVLHWRKSSGVQSLPAQYSWNGKKVKCRMGYYI